MKVSLEREDDCMKIKTLTEKGKLRIKVFLSLLSYVNQKDLTILKDNYLIGFLRPENHSLFHIEYSGTMGITLSEYMSKPLNKTEFNHILMQIILATETLTNNHLPLQYLVLDTSNIYINNIDKKIQLLYVPSSNKKASFPILPFLCSLAYNAIPETAKDSDYLEQLINYLKILKEYDFGVMKSYLLKTDKSLTDMVKRHQTALTGSTTQSVINQDDDITVKSDSQAVVLNNDEIDETVLDDNDGTILEDTDQTTVIDEADLDDSTVDMRNAGIPANDDLDVTVELNHYLNNQSKNNYPKLMRLADNEEIEINKAVFRIGRSAECVDYAITDNKLISKIHADIIQRADGCFVVDQGSGNQTYLNENCLQPKWEAQLKDGDHLKFANEEFVFHMK